jgi:hypothetical protein
MASAPYGILMKRRLVNNGDSNQKKRRGGYENIIWQK